MRWRDRNERIYAGATLSYARFMSPTLRPRILATRACAIVLAMTLLEGCASTVHVFPSNYIGLDGKGTAVISMRNGRIYQFHKVAVDSSRFMGQVNIVRNVVSRDGHLDAIEDVQQVRLPFGEVESVELRHPNIFNSALLAGAAAAGLAVLIRAFQPEPATTPTGGGGGGVDNTRPGSGASGH